MIFDETVREVQLISMNGLDDMSGEDAIRLINMLRQEYAPTVEMTEMQMKQMMSFKEVNAGFSTFMYKQGLGQLPAFSDFITTKRENELLQAWLHPETIKVIGEENDTAKGSRNED